ncbi:MAG: hypothetical protein IJY31_08315 [Muribaculaceae bacterium]|nr:hypothetical protein [Muribaculaceae bacterium]
MKKLLSVFTLLIAMVAGTATALTITKVDKVNPNDDEWIDMALTSAKASVSEGGKPCGAVVVLNGALRSVGRPTATATAEETAIATSRRKKLNNAVIYTVNEPTTEAYNAICRAGADAVVFVNSRDEVIACGIYPAEAYNDAAIDSTLTQVPMSQISYPEAATFLKSNKK